MTETKLQFLTKPNIPLLCRKKGTPEFTFNDLWDPIENVANWSDFTYINLVQRYSSDLNAPISIFNPGPVCEEAGVHEIWDEDGFKTLAFIINILPVSYALPGTLFIAPGGQTMENAAIHPDWGAGDKTKRNKLNRYKGLVFGDAKYGWSHEDAIRVVRESQYGYENTEGRELVLPMEQTAHYSTINQSAYTFILSERGLLVMRLRRSEDPVRASPRPKRNIRNRQTHQRVVSGSTVSEAIASISEMSIDDEVKKGPANIGVIEYSMIPWEGRRDGMTPNLGLYCLIRLAKEDNSLRQDYAPLQPQLMVLIPQPQQSRGDDKTLDPKGKVKSTEISGNTSSTKSSHFRMIESIRLSSDKKNYVYKLDGGWKLLPVSEWKQHGGYLFHYELKLQAQKP